jgi:hypothetical protein
MATLIAEKALGSDQGQRFVYVVNDENEIVYRKVQIGALHEGLRVIEEGLAKGERVVVNGLQRVRPGVKVEPKEVKMREVAAAGRTPVVIKRPEPMTRQEMGGKAQVAGGKAR